MNARSPREGKICLRLVGVLKLLKWSIYLDRRNSVYVDNQESTRLNFSLVLFLNFLELVVIALGVEMTLRWQLVRSYQQQ